MGHELLNVGIHSTTSATTDKKSSIAADGSERGDAKPFSSTLDEQVEKQSVANENQVKHKNTVAHDDKVSTKKDEGNDVIVSDSGNDSTKHVNQDEAVVDDSVLNLGDTEQVESPLSDNDDEGQTELLLELDQPPASTLPADSQLTDTEIATMAPLSFSRGQVEAEKTATLAAEPLNKAAATIPPKTVAVAADVTDTNVDVAVKPVVRSDIFHAILRKEPANSDGVVKELPVSVDKQVELPLTERAKLSIDGAALLKPLGERAAPTFASPLTAVTVGSPAQQTASVVPSALSIQPAIQSEAWGKVLSSRVIWMAREGVQQAELRLNPASLGPVEVKLHMNNDQASIAFVAANAATRDALEQALPRLKESFQENGMNLADTDVSDHAAEQQHAEQQENSTNTQLQPSLSQAETDNDNQQHIEQQPMSQGELDIGVSVFV